jgi:hypothetical protein
MKPSLRNSTWYAKLACRSDPRGVAGSRFRITAQKVTEWPLSLSDVFDFIHFPVEISEMETRTVAGLPASRVSCLWRLRLSPPCPTRSHLWVELFRFRVELVHVPAER